MAQPKIELPPDDLDNYLLSITVFFGLFLVGYPLLKYGNLPAEIPIHFRIDGTPDRYGSKAEIWILPIIGILLTALLRWLATMPHYFNYSVKITANNAADQYQIAARLVKIIAVIIVIAFAYITYGIIQAVEGEGNGLSSWFLPVLLGALFITIGYYLSQSFKKEK